MILAYCITVLFKIPINMKANLLQYSDELLVQHYLLTSNETAFEIIFDRYSQLVFLVCMRYTRDEMLAEDLTMEVFETLVKQKKDKVITHLKSWLYTVAKNKCFDAIAKAKTVSIEENKQAIPSNEISEIGEVVVIFLNKFLNLLKHEQKECIELFYFEGLSYDSITELTGFSNKKVKSALQNGKRNLRLLFEQTPGFRYETVQSFFR